MNRKMSVFILISLFVFCFVLAPQSAYAAFPKGPVQKFGRGFFHVVSAIFQIPKEIIQTTSDSTAPPYLAPLQGFFQGFGSGVYLGIRQIISGFADMFTFWTPAGRDWGPIYEPATLFPEI